MACRGLPPPSPRRCLQRRENAVKKLREQRPGREEGLYVRLPFEENKLNPEQRTKKTISSLLSRTISR
jgi:hypothetical protein